MCIMSVEIVTKEDLQELRRQLLNDMEALLQKQEMQLKHESDKIEGYKTSHVRKDIRLFRK
jgi:hypothetical protein